MPSLTRLLALKKESFARLVTILQQTNKTCTVVEQSCGGLISSSIMEQPGASKVFWGGSVVYNTKQCQPLLLNNPKLHQTLLKQSKRDTPKAYRQSKLDWTRETALAFGHDMKTDYVITEGGAVGPTYSVGDSGFIAACVAHRHDISGDMRVLQHRLFEADPGNDRVYNMNLFATAVADLAIDLIADNEGVDLEDPNAEYSQVSPYAQEDVDDDDDDDNNRDDDNVIDISPPPTTNPQESFGNNILEPNPASLEIDRATHLRSNPLALLDMEQVAMYVVLHGHQILVQQDEPSTLARLDYQEVQEATKSFSSQSTFLGLVTDHKLPCFAIDVLAANDSNSSSSSGDTDQPWTPPPGTVLANTRTQAPLFAPLDNSLALHATALAQWQRRTKFCSQCGGPVALQDAGTSCRCTGCQTPSWPRQDPSMITLVSSRDGQRVLLARSPRHPPKLHTVLAGFVEAGERLEEAVAREVYEEVGLVPDLDSIEYKGSQPWPFPQSCMVGFRATADDTLPLKVDEKELVSAGWFDKEVVRKAAQIKGATMQAHVAEQALRDDASLELLIPPQGVIARKLIDDWLEQ